MSAVKLASEHTIRIMLGHGAEPKLSDCEGWTALHWVGFTGSFPAAKILLRAGAEIDAPNTERTTPLLLAAKHINTDVAQALLEHGADTECADHEGRTPLLLAAKNRANTPVQILLNTGTEPHHRDTSGTSVDVINESGSTPLFSAVLGCDTRITALLLRFGADLQHPQYTTTPLMLAIERNSELALHDLLEADADPHHPAPVRPTFHALAHQRLKLLKHRFAHGADLEARNEQHETLLNAAGNRHAPYIEKLIAIAADRHARDDEDRDVVAYLWAHQNATPLP